MAATTSPSMVKTKTAPVLFATVTQQSAIKFSENAPNYSQKSTVQ